MIFRAVQNTLENGQIRHHAASVEVLGAIEDDLIAFRSDLEIAIARVDGSSDELT